MGAWYFYIKPLIGIVNGELIKLFLFMYFFFPIYPLYFTSRFFTADEVNFNFFSYDAKSIGATGFENFPALAYDMY